MIKTDLYTIDGKKEGKIDLSEEIFAVKVKPVLLSQAVRVFLSNQRKAGAKAKTRSEVSGSGVKIYRQKGTGRARHGDRYAPIFVGGGVAHGPTGWENYRLKLSKKMRRKALFGSLTSKFKAGEIVFVTGLEKIGSKTKKTAQALDKIIGPKQKVLIIHSGNSEDLLRSAGNLAGVSLQSASRLNSYLVLNGGQLVFSKESLSVLEKTYLGSKAEPEKKKQPVQSKK